VTILEFVLKLCEGIFGGHKVELSSHTLEDYQKVINDKVYGVKDDVDVI
jgi:hypothetical protein